jgi:3-deoxy-D-manno-octulosonate 8-phosphate phosphatase (KDO 8-P phosphatase)
MTLQERAARIRLLLFDVDGVLTNGVVYMHADGSESKGFHIHDGAAMVWAQQAGLTVAWLSGRRSTATSGRAAELGVTLVVQGVTSKLEAFQRIVRDTGVTENAVAYMGDDLIDLPVLARVGLSAAPADAARDVRDRVAWVSTARGGRGAVREFIEMILRAQQRWDAILGACIPPFDDAQSGPEALEGPAD